MDTVVVRCVAHGLYAKRERGKWLCPKGHDVTEDGTPKPRRTPRRLSSTPSNQWY
jgi:hypothetical protein